MRPMAYVVMAPVSDTLDTLTLLAVRQHIALVLGLVVLFVAWRIVKARRTKAGWRSHRVPAGALLLLIVLAYAGAAVLPRPMAALVADNANILIVDFHSHTSASHDGRSGFSPERNRAWHRDAGYNVAFVTDHATVAAAERGIADNPQPAALGVTLLQGIEASWNGEHVGVLNAERAYKGLLTNGLRDVDAQSLALASFIQGREPIVVWNHPRDLTKLPAASQPRMPGVRAIEIVNGSPANMDRIQPHRAAIVAFADQNNIALVSGSDNHGWGRATPGWTLMRVFDWRSLTSDPLALRIEAAIRESGFRSTRVVERVVADPGANSILLSLTVLAAPLRMLTTLSNEERVVWLVWIWLIWTAVWLRKRAQRPTA